MFKPSTGGQLFFFARGIGAFLGQQACITRRSVCFFQCFENIKGWRQVSEATKFSDRRIQRRSVGLVAKDFFRVLTDWPQKLQPPLRQCQSVTKNLIKEFKQLKAIGPRRFSTGSWRQWPGHAKGEGGGGVAGMAISGALHAHEVHCSAEHEGSLFRGSFPNGLYST